MSLIQIIVAIRETIPLSKIYYLTLVEQSTIEYQATTNPTSDRSVIDKSPASDVAGN